MPNRPPRRRWYRHPALAAGAALVLAAPVLALTGAVAPVAAAGLAVAGAAGGAGVALARTRDRGEPAPGEPGDDIGARLDAIEAGIVGKVPDAVEARVQRVTGTLRETLPRLGELGPGSAMARDAVQTATSYLPEALGAYLRLPRSFADHRAVSGGKTPLHLLCDQLDLLAAEMDQVFVAVCRADADALVAHGRFLAEKFGAGSSLDLPQVGSS